MGLDVGSKTIGVAIADELGIAAHPVTTIARRGNAGDSEQVASLAEEHQITDVVIGLPLELSGAVGHRAARVRAFADALRARLNHQIAMHEWDERFSTAAVERVLIDADLSRRRRKQVIDQQAAAYILQGWLDSQARR